MPENEKKIKEFIGLEKKKCQKLIDLYFKIKILLKT